MKSPKGGDARAVTHATSWNSVYIGPIPSTYYNSIKSYLLVIQRPFQYRKVTMRPLALSFYKGKIWPKKTEKRFGAWVLLLLLPLIWQLSFVRALGHGIPPSFSFLLSALLYHLSLPFFTGSFALDRCFGLHVQNFQEQLCSSPGSLVLQYKFSFSLAHVFFFFSFKSQYMLLVYSGTAHTHDAGQLHLRTPILWRYTSLCICFSLSLPAILERRLHTVTRSRAFLSLCTFPFQRLSLYCFYQRRPAWFIHLYVPVRSRLLRTGWITVEKLSTVETVVQFTLALCK